MASSLRGMGEGTGRGNRRRARRGTAPPAPPGAERRRGLWLCTAAEQSVSGDNW